MWFRNRKIQKWDYFFKPLTIILIFLVPVLNSHLAENRLFIHYITMGLFFSILGDSFLILKQRYFMIGLVSFLITHLFYISAVISINSFQISWIILLSLFIWIMFIRHTLPSVNPSVKPAVLIYSLVLAILFWQGLELLWIKKSLLTLGLFVGITLFLISDWMLVENLFESKNRFSRIKLPIYFIGQWLIAVSTIVN